jgi:hypothetical protein
LPICLAATYRRRNNKAEEQFSQQGRKGHKDESF